MAGSIPSDGPIALSHMRDFGVFGENLGPGVGGVDRGVGRSAPAVTEPEEQGSGGHLAHDEARAGAILDHRLESPVVVEYAVMAVAEGGPNDEVRDINCFWMATDSRVPSGDIRERPRSGAFVDYDVIMRGSAATGTPTRVSAVMSAARATARCCRSMTWRARRA